MLSKRVLVFDLDNTFFNSDAAYIAAQEHVGIKADDKRWQQAKHNVKDLLGDGHPSSHNRCLYFKEYLRLQNDLSAVRILDLLNRYETKLVEDLSQQIAILNRSDFLHKLSSAFTLALLTNETTRTQLLKIAALDPEGKFFSTIVTSEEAGAEKPTTKIFETLENRLGCQLRACTMIGDSYKDDIEPALAHGMDVIITQEFATTKPSFSLPAGVRSIKKLEKLNEVLTWP